MAESGFLAQKPKSPTGLIIVIAMHGAALTALALSKAEIIPGPTGPIDVYNVPVDPPPPPPEPAPQPLPKSTESVIEAVPPVIPVPADSDRIALDPPRLPPVDLGFTAGAGSVPADPPRPPPLPVRIDARMSSSSILQPPYPASEQRLDREGSVTILLVIGPDGRVISAQPVRATSDAFYRATERHALRHWRFHPATLDGRPVESRKEVTVDFRLDG